MRDIIHLVIDDSEEVECVDFDEVVFRHCETGAPIFLLVDYVKMR